MSFADGRTRDDLHEDDQLVFALVKAVEIIGEAAGKIPLVFRQASPEISWQEMLAMRIRLAHIYFNVNPEYVWRTVQEDLPPLRQSVQRLLNDYEG